MSISKHYGFNTRAIHEGYDPQEALGSLVAPLYLSSTFAFDSAEEAAATFSGERERFVYGRVHNPTQSLLEARLASMEGGEASVVMASGMGAISSLMWALLKPGDEVIAHHRMYGNTFTLLSKALHEFQISVKLIDLSCTQNLEAYISRKTRIVFFESPANPQLEIIDIEYISNIAHHCGALAVVDNTLASPYLQRPLELGADLVVHSMTKYLCGHGDVLAGAVVGRQDLIKQVRMKGLRYMTGATLAPFSAFLVLRGLKTLGIRMERHCCSAQVISEALEASSKVAAVYYPGLTSHPQHALAKRYMRLPGGLIALELAGGVDAGRNFMNRVRLAKLAVSFGDAETLVQHPASMTHAGYGPDALRQVGLSPSLIRISVGLEDVEDILEDFMQALHGG